VVAFHLVRLIAPPYLQEELRRERGGRPGEGGKGAEGAAIIIDEPGAYKEP
jgi:hypothetical protein